MIKTFIMKDNKGNMEYDDAFLIKDIKDLKAITHPIKMSILKSLKKKAKCPAEIAKELDMHEQKIYYHVQQLAKSGIIEVIEKRAVRGTVAKIYAAKNTNIAFKSGKKWKDASGILKKTDNKKLNDFFNPIIKDGRLDGKIIVGSPDPHGPHKARSRDGHYAIDLGVYLGNLCKISDNFYTNLDVDINFNEDTNLIVVGGPVTNLIMAKINKHMPANFDDSKQWGIQGKDFYTDDNIGIIAKIPHPKYPNRSILAIAGIRFSGTKAAVIALSRYTEQVLNRFTGQKEYYCIVEGFDLDGDGRIDSIEVLE